MLHIKYYYIVNMTTIFSIYMLIVTIYSRYTEFYMGSASQPYRVAL